MVSIQAVRDELIKVAKRKGTIPYSEFAPIVGMHHRSSHFHRLLGEVSEAENAAQRPLLSAVVINKQYKRAGNGFLGLAQSCGRCAGLDDKQCWEQEVQRVHDHWSKQP